MSQQTIPALQNGYAALHLENLSDEVALPLTTEEKISRISYHFREIMLALGLGLDNDSLKDTPQRVARMYVQETFAGLDPANKPQMALFENDSTYSEMLIEKNIQLYSYCEHHFVPIVGKVHVAYLPGSRIIGLSKIHKLVRYYARRPQVQERLTQQIAQGLKEALQTDNVAIVVDAVHYCVVSRGVQDATSSTRTAHYGGRFARSDVKKQFLSLVQS